MLSVASHSRLPPNREVTAGLINHSPPPMAAPPASSPGPSMAAQFLQRKRGASCNAPTFQRGIALEPGYGASTVAGEADWGESINSYPRGRRVKRPAGGNRARCGSLRFDRVGAEGQTHGRREVAVEPEDE